MDATQIQQAVQMAAAEAQIAEYEHLVGSVARRAANQAALVAAHKKQIELMQQIITEKDEQLKSALDAVAERDKTIATMTEGLAQVGRGKERKDPPLKVLESPLPVIDVPARA